MVNTQAQLYTMEGIAAGVVMILTAYLVLGSTSVYTPGDTHITDMQLEQVGADILKIMDAPTTFNATENPAAISELEQIVATNDGARFDNVFWRQYLMLENAHIAAQKSKREGSAPFTNATVYYHSSDGTVKGYQLSTGIVSYSGSEPGVRVTRFVKVPAKNVAGYGGCICGPNCACMPDDVREGPQVMLVEVFLWKA